MKLKKFVSLLILVTTVFTLMPVVNASAATTKKVDFPTAYCASVDGYEYLGYNEAYDRLAHKKTVEVVSADCEESIMELRVKKNQSGYYRIGTRGKFKSFKNKVQFSLYGNTTIFAYAKENGVKSQVRKIKYMQSMSWTEYLTDEEMCLTKPIDYAVWFESGAKAYYTLDGTKPTKKSKQLKSEEEIPITKDCTLRVLIIKKGFKDVNLYYNFVIDSKSNKLARESGIINYSGVYDLDVSIRVSDYFANGDVYCTLDGSKPTKKSRKVPVGFCDDEIILKETTTVNYLWINESGKKQYFSQTYIIRQGMDNSSTNVEWRAGDY